ncbi:MAG: DNA-processing protein DprA [Spirochaetaceae bacterium]|jgi:DNA processing protein|nr:DNA-processing protein DprA [Spirochaetaceae bacterium]
MNNRGLLDFIITRIPHISPVDKISLCTRFTSEADIISLTKADLEQILGRFLPKLKWDLDLWIGQAEQDTWTITHRGMNTVSYASPDYPPLLREIYDPPHLIFYWGQLPDPERPLVAMVGTRRPASPGAMFAIRVSKEFADAGVSVVSGLALGIDGFSHRGNLSARTIAVLASGLDELSPAANKVLARKILEQGGCIMTEYPPGTPPHQWRFPTRNRIISGLSRGTLIVEAPERSGALITGRCALEQGRDVWVAGLYGEPLGEGSRKFANEGARVVSSAYEILEEWEAKFTVITSLKEEP